MSAAALAALDALLARGKVTDGKGFALDGYSTAPDLPPGLEKEAAEVLLPAGVKRLAALQERLYAHNTWSVLLVFQARDAAGKDGTIKHVLSGVNPQGVSVTSFKAPGPVDLAHDFLWRVSRVLPARGMIGVFNRSYYEEVLVPRIHPEALARQRLPEVLTSDPGFWKGRLDDIAAFERHLGREGTLVLKFFLHVGRDEQRKRLLARLDEPDKLWKFDPSDVSERRFWAETSRAYEAAVTATATERAPWHIIPADRKWLMRLLVMKAVVEAIEGLGLASLKPTPAQLANVVEARRLLASEP